MNIEQSAFHDIVNTKVKRQVANRLNNSVATSVEEIFTDPIQLGTDSVDSQKKLTLNIFIGVSISRMIYSGKLDFYLETLLSNLADSTMFVESIVPRIMTQKRFTKPAVQFAKITVHDFVQAATIKARF